MATMLRDKINAKTELEWLNRLIETEKNGILRIKALS